MLKSVQQIAHTEILAADHAKDHGRNAQLQQITKYTGDQCNNKLQYQGKRVVGVSDECLGKQTSDKGEYSQKYCGSDQCGIMAFECVPGQCF